MNRKRRLLLPLLLAGLLACEDDALVATSGFTPTECTDDDNCNTGATLDAGRVPLDSGAPNVPVPDDSGVPVGNVDSGVDIEPDTGADPDTGVEPDAGVIADATPPADTGVVPDSGVPLDVGFPVDAGPPPEFLNLAGSHRVHYIFDLSRYLFGIGSLAEPLDVIDQALAGNINTGFPPLDLLIGNIIQRFVPPWVVTVVDVLNSIANFFEEVEARGTMNIAQSLPMGQISQLNGTESWSVLQVRIISACPGGRMDPNYPMCAQQNIPIAMPPAMIGPLEIGVDVKPFTGVLQPGVPEADFMFDDREIDMELTKLVRVVIDLAINLGTNGQIPTLRDALDMAIDCAALQMEAEQLALSFGLAPVLATTVALGVRNACDREKMRALDAIINGINGIGIGWEAMEFDQIGRAIDTNGNSRPETLQTLATPDTIDGRFKLLVRDRMGGRWEGVNLNP